MTRRRGGWGHGKRALRRSRQGAPGVDSSHVLGTDGRRLLRARFRSRRVDALPPGFDSARPSLGDAGHDGPSTAGLARVSLRGSRRGVVDQRRSPPHRQARVRRLRQRHHRRARRPGALRVVRFRPRHLRVPHQVQGRGRRSSRRRDEPATCAGRCLFLALPVDVPWEGVPRDAHVIFAGLAFLFNQGTMTVDADDRRLRLGGRPGPVDA